MIRLVLVLNFFVLALEAKPIVLGVVPQQSPLKLFKAWKPVATYLSKKIGQTVVFKTEKSIGTFEKALYSGDYDLAYMNPYHYVLAHHFQKYEAKVRAKKNIIGIMVAPKNYHIEDIGKYKKIVFPSPNAFAATLLIKYELSQKYSNLFAKETVRYVNSHDSVYKNIARGKAAFGGGIERTFYNLKDASVKDKLSIVYKTKAYPSHPFGFHPRLDPKTQEKLIKALLSLPKDILEGLNVKGLKPINHGEYQEVSELAKILKIMPK